MTFQTTEARIFQLIEEDLTLRGFELLSVKYDSGHAKLSIIIDKINLDDPKVTSDDCGLIIKIIKPLIDVSKIIKANYNFEVSSAGLERPLIKRADYIKFAGREVLIKLSKINISENETENKQNKEEVLQKQYKGKLLGMDDNDILIEYINEKSEKIIKKLPFEDVKSAKLVLTEEIFRSILKQRPIC